METIFEPCRVIVDTNDRFFSPELVLRFRGRVLYFACGASDESGEYAVFRSRSALNSLIYNFQSGDSTENQKMGCCSSVRNFAPKAASNRKRYTALLGVFHDPFISLFAARAVTTCN